MHRFLRGVEKSFPHRGKIGQSFYVLRKISRKFLRSVEKSRKVFTCYVKTAESFYVLRKTCDTAAMNTIFSAAMILWIFGMVIYLTKDM